MFETLDNSSDY